MKRIRNLILVIIIILVITGSFVSRDKFGTYNFISGGIGFVKVYFLDEPYVIVQSNPPVFLYRYPFEMADELSDYGYSEMSDERMGSMLVFENKGNKYFAQISINAYVSKIEFLSRVPEEIR